jgi:hypothetical protein
VRSDYERLRRDALERGALGWRWGGSVLARAGVAAWIRAWSEHAAAGEEAIVTSPATPQRSSMATLAPPGPTSDAAAAGEGDAIVALLALMLRGLLTGASRAGANA